MTTEQLDDLSLAVATVRSQLGAANPVPDPSLDHGDVLAARASVGIRRAGSPAPQPRGRLVLAGGAIAVLAGVGIVAAVTVPGGDTATSLTAASGKGAKAVNGAVPATAGAGSARALVTVVFGDKTLTATGVGDLSKGVGQADIDLPPGTGLPLTKLTIISTGDVVYVAIPEPARALAGGKPWASIDRATFAQLSRTATGGAGAEVTPAPLDVLGYLRAFSGDVSVIGPDMVRGAPTTHYRGAIDPALVAAKAPADEQAKAADAAAKVGQTIPTDLWLDAQGRLRKLVVTADPAKASLPADATRPAGPVTVTFELYDFGTPVSVQAPPADQVSDVGPLLAGFLTRGAKTP